MKRSLRSLNTLIASEAAAGDNNQVAVEAIIKPQKSNSNSGSVRLRQTSSNRNKKNTENDIEKKSKYFDDGHCTISKKSDRVIRKSAVPPANWELQLENIRKMRQSADAPVDTMGCDKISDEMAPAKDQRYQSLLALMLSSQTKDQITAGAMKKLIDHGCTVDNIANTEPEILEDLIYPVSFYKTKVRNVKKVTDILVKEWDSDIPNTVENLCKLPGIGPKMAHLTMQCAWGVVTGIAADTHVHRISNRLGWVKTKAPEKTQIELEEWLPRELWSEVNYLLVGFGQQICTSIKPKCQTCLNKDICSSSNSNSDKRNSSSDCGSGGDVKKLKL